MIISVTFSLVFFFAFFWIHIWIGLRGIESIVIMKVSNWHVRAKSIPSAVYYRHRHTLCCVSIPNQSMSRFDKYTIMNGCFSNLCWRDRYIWLHVGCVEFRVKYQKSLQTTKRSVSCWGQTPPGWNEQNREVNMLDSAKVQEAQIK